MTKPKTNGFTIVELLIVIVVIAILAAITIVAFNGVQTRARDTARTQSLRSLQKSLAAYKAINGVYPAHIAIGTNAPAGFSGRFGTSYSYSVDTAGNWLKGLTTSNTISTVPIDPTNDNNHYFGYWASSAGYGKCTEPFYVLFVIGYEDASNIPSDSRTLTCTWGGSTANWVASSGTAVFSNITTPPDPS